MSPVDTCGIARLCTSRSEASKEEMRIKRMGVKGKLKLVERAD